MRALFAGVIGLALTGCAETPQRVADRFVDRYFVEADQARARPLTAGLAQKKIDDELKLVGPVRQAEDDREQKRPTVFYERRELSVEGERARATYDLTIRFGSDETRKNALLSLEHAEGVWRVANFMVAEGHLPGPRPAGK